MSDLQAGCRGVGIDNLKVQEIRGYVEPTRIANAPAFIKGVVNLRGVIVPIVDLRMKFDLGAPVYDAMTVVIILNVAGRTIGAVVDSVATCCSWKASRSSRRLRSMLRSMRGSSPASARSSKANRSGC